MKLKIFKMKKICEWKVEDKMANIHYCIVIAVRIEGCVVCCVETYVRTNRHVVSSTYLKHRDMQTN